MCRFFVEHVMTYASGWRRTRADSQDVLRIMAETILISRYYRMFQKVCTEVLSMFDDDVTVTFILRYRYINRRNHFNAASVIFRNITAIMERSWIVSDNDRYLLSVHNYFDQATRTMRIIGTVQRDEDRNLKPLTVYIGERSSPKKLDAGARQITTI